jgi:hypothetical protein
MAYQVEYWRDDGKGHTQIRAARLQKFSREFQSVIFANGTVASFKELSAQPERPPGCTLITIGRTDAQSPTEYTIWAK